ncbi:hypothetical protein [Taibaiella chishuiensis]|uniref:Uncharacterized protein n=1 Tax=Taibaiella chishuiensis TaxID=1434707 RepID=A0A2P8DAX0_9BACT|nr:hypothetical protein [Taibaiella chishuiensis]PSK94363.1 hypothetical protein B0I18_101518 [Taibaiella chishuiensis]
MIYRAKTIVKQQKIAIIGAFWGIFFIIPLVFLIADLCHNYSKTVLILSFLSINAVLAFIHARKNLRSFLTLFLVYTGITLLSSGLLLWVCVQADIG